MAFEGALAIDPAEPFANYNLGRLQFRRGMLAQARGHLCAALESRAEFAEALIVLAAVLDAQGELVAAATALESALRLRPDDFGACYHYGVLLKKLDRPAEAESVLQRACALDPGSADANYQLATLLQARGSLSEAERRLRDILEREPARDDARAALFHVLQTQGNLGAALSEVEILLQHQPDRVDALYNRGLVLKSLRRLPDAETTFKRLLAISPDYVPALQMLASVLLGQTRIDDALAVYAAARERHPEDIALQSAEVFALNFAEGISVEALFEKHRACGARIEAMHRPRQAMLRNVPDERRRLRIGYLSGDFCFHVVALFMLPLLERHERSSFEIYCYSIGDRVDEYSRQLCARADVWRDAAALSEAGLAETIERDAIDILIDLSGHSGNSQLGVFARQPAPVQATWLGYLNTTGMTRIQYRICDRHTDPPGIAERLHTEQLVRLPESQWCYRPFLAAAYAASPPSERKGFVTFGSFTQPAKLSPSVRRLWREILRRVPESRLLVAGVSEGRARDELVRDLVLGGIAPARVTILPYLALTDYFAAFREVDIALDTFPYSGGTTTCDTLWMGVPVVTVPGARPPSRSAASVLRTMGLEEWIAGTQEEYVQLAVKFARDAPRLAELRRSLRRRMQESPLMDEARFARDMEQAYRRMWTDWCRDVARHPPAAPDSPSAAANREKLAESHAAHFERYRDEGHWAAALQAIEAVLEHRPDWIDARYNHGFTLMTLERFGEAEAAFRRVLALDPGYAIAYRMLGNLLHRQARIGELVELCRIGRERLPERFDLESFELFALNFAEDISAEALFERHRAFGEHLERAIAPRTDAFGNPRDPHRRVRVGYVSGDLSCHPVALFLLSLLQHHDHSRYETYCYSTSTTNDDFTRQAAARTDAWRPVAALSDEELAESIRRDGIDILVDLSGHSGSSRLGVFARQPAPIQAAWLGYLNTTGMTRIQYRICDRHTDPPGIAERLHTEQLVRLPHSQWCYRPFVSVAGGAELPCKRNRYVTFGSFNQAAKLSPTACRLWAQILAHMPDARLVVLGVPEGTSQQALLREFANRGVAPNRVTARPHLPLADYYRTIADTDIALDTFPYSGGTTTCDTLWMGVPVVTVPGARPPSRSAASVLRTMGLEEWIAGTQEEYVQLAVKFARDAPRLAELRRSLRRRMQESPLMDEARFARDMEQAYRRMWTDWCEDSVA